MARRRGSRPYVALFLFALLGSAFVSWLQLPGRSTAALFRTRATILISPNTGESQLHYEKVTDPRLVRDLLQEQEFLQEAVRLSGSSWSWIDLRAALDVQTRGHLVDKVDQVELSVLGSNSEVTAKVTQAVIECFSQRLRSMAVKEHDEALQQLDQEFQRLEARVQHAARVVSGRAPALSDSQLTRRLYELQARSLDLDQEIRLLDAETPAFRSGFLYALERQKEALQLAALRVLYRPAAPPVVAQEQRLSRVTRLFEAEQKRREAVENQRRQRRKAALSRSLGEIRREMKDLDAQRLSPAALLDLSVRRRELEMWQSQLDGIRLQKQRERFAREKSLASLLILVVQKPEPGLAVLLPTWKEEFWTVWRRYLPIGLVAALGIGSLLWVQRSQKSMRVRIQESIGLPILGDIPRWGHR